METEVESQKNGLDIIPLELWVTILERVRDPKDVENCAKTCKTWEDILRVKRQVYLFHKVFPIILASMNDDDYDDRIYEPDVLNCRLVCRMWKEAVDSYLQNHEKHAEIGAENSRSLFDFASYVWEPSFEFSRFRKTDDDDFRNEVRAIHPHEMFTFLNLDELREFSQRSDENILEDNWIFTKCLQIRDFSRDMESKNEMWAYAADTFLPKFGPHVHCFRLCYSFADAPSSLFNTVRMCLEHLPNMKTFHLEVGYFQNSGYQQLDDLFKSCQREASGGTPCNPRHLAMLKLKNVPVAIVNFLMKWYSRIDKLELAIVTEVNVNYKNQLECGNWRHDTLSVLEAHIRCRHNFLELLKLSWPLRKLFLVVFLPELNNWKELADIVNKFKDTLVELNLHFGILVEDEDTKGIQFNLPHLKSLTITSSGKYIPNCFDFILPSTSLEELHVIRKWNRYTVEAETRARRLDGASRIEFIGHERSLYKSNIWDLMPNLQRVTLLVTLFNDNDLQNGPRLRYEYFYKRCERELAIALHGESKVQSKIADDAAASMPTNSPRQKVGTGIIIYGLLALLLIYELLPQCSA